MVSKRKTIKNKNKKFRTTRKQKGGMEITEEERRIQGMRLVRYAWLGNISVVQDAIDNGADINHTNKEGHTALMEAIYNK